MVYSVTAKTCLTYKNLYFFKYLSDEDKIIRTFFKLTFRSGFLFYRIELKLNIQISKKISSTK